jgi:acyl-CoA thioesterase-1
MRQRPWSFRPSITRRRAIAGLAGFSASLATRGAHAAAPPVVTVLGDSITAGLGLSAADALPAQLQTALARLGVAAIVRGAGVSGDTSAGGLARLEFSVQPDTAVCVVELGANDYLQSIDPRETAGNLDQIVARLKARKIAVVLAAGTAPAHSAGDYGRAFDALFPKIAATRHVVLAPDFLAGVAGNPKLRQADGLHPNAAGVRIMAARLAPFVARALKREMG